MGVNLFFNDQLIPDRFCYQPSQLVIDIHTDFCLI